MGSAGKWACDRLTEDADFEKKSSFKMKLILILANCLVQMWWMWSRGIIGPCWTNFCSQKLKRRILAKFGFNRTALHATRHHLRSTFWALFFKIALSAAGLMSFSHLGAAIWHRWNTICRVPSKISVTPTSQRQLTL